MAQRSPNAAIIAEIESSLRSGTHEKRTSTLMRVTDLFIAAADRYSEEEVKLFDDVMGHLVQHVESRALAELSRRIAPIITAPQAVIGKLARHDDIDVSGPVLSESPRLSDTDMVEIALTKSQAHLAKIAGRQSLNESVTEVLVEHGDDHVAHTVAGNAGARFSRHGMAKLVLRAEGNDRLAESMLNRQDIPPRLFRQLTLQATEAVRARLLDSAAPEQRDVVKKVMDELASQIGRRRTEPPRNYGEAQRAISQFVQDTDVLKRKILEFADANKLEEVIAALSALTGVATKDIDVFIRAGNELGLTVLCKAIALPLDTAFAVIMVSRGDPNAAEAEVHDDFCEYYDNLTTGSAQKLLHFWQGRQLVAQRFAKP